MCRGKHREIRTNIELHQRMKKIIRGKGKAFKDKWLLFGQWQPIQLAHHPCRGIGGKDYSSFCFGKLWLEPTILNSQTITYRINCIDRAWDKSSKRTP